MATFTFKQGDCVEAVDGAGRWCSARVIQVHDDGNTEVTFPGWTKRFDVLVSTDMVRNCKIYGKKKQNTIPTECNN